MNFRRIVIPSPLIDVFRAIREQFEIEIMSAKHGIKIVPIIVGVLTQSVGTVATAMVLVVSLAASGLQDYEILPRMHSFSGLMLNLIATLGFTAVGGYFAGQMARQSPLLHGGVVGAIGLMLMLLCREGGLPLWYDILSLGGMIPAGAIGGLVAGQSHGPDGSDTDGHDRPR